jgi:hypothetical protein
MALMGLWKAPWWHLGLVSASTLLLGEDGKAERGVPATARAAELASQVQQEQSERAELDCPPIGCNTREGHGSVHSQTDKSGHWASGGSRSGQQAAGDGVGVGVGVGDVNWQLAIASNPGVFCVLTVAAGRWARDSMGHCR